MDAYKVLSLLEQLDEEIDDLEESLAPLLTTALSETASKLPLLDKAKLYVLVTYAIESILFSYLRLNGVKAREHPVFTELTRVKQYFEKIKLVEHPVGKRENLSVDKGVAARMIKAGLSGNDKYDLERAEQQAKERAKAHIKFGALSEKKKQEELSKKRKADRQTVASDTDSNSDSESDSELSARGVDSPSPPEVSSEARKRAAPTSQTNALSKPGGFSSASDQSSSGRSKKKKKNKRRRQGAKVQ